MKHFKKFILLFVTTVILLAGCSSSNPQAISIIIPIQADQFSKQAVVRVDLWNAEQLAIDEANPMCVVMGNGSGITSTQCPPGTVYKEVTPEEFTFPIGEIGDQIQVTSSRLKLGEKFRITVGGMSADDCNGRSTRYIGLVNTQTISLKDLEWATTQMGCVKTP